LDEAAWRSARKCSPVLVLESAVGSVSRRSSAIASGGLARRRSIANCKRCGEYLVRHAYPLYTARRLAVGKVRSCGCHRRAEASDPCSLVKTDPYKLLATLRKGAAKEKRVAAPADMQTMKLFRLHVKLYFG
jgi:hypothetical protein